MGKYYSKSDVKFHSDGFRGGHPAINVKVRNFVMASQIADKFSCNEKIAEKAGEFAFNSAQVGFWEGIQENAEYIFGSGIEVYQEGRSGGWLVIRGLPDIEEWDAVMLGRWHKFECECREEIKFFTSEEYVFDAIEANRWAEEGAEEYNFIDKKDGTHACMVDLNKNLANTRKEFLSA